MSGLRIRTVLIGLAALAPLLGLIRSKAASVRSSQSVLTDTIITGIVFCVAIAIIGNTGSRRLALALVALLAAIAMTSS